LACCISIVPSRVSFDLWVVGSRLSSPHFLVGVRSVGSRHGMVGRGGKPLSRHKPPGIRPRVAAPTERGDKRKRANDGQTGSLVVARAPTRRRLDRAAPLTAQGQNNLSPSECTSNQRPAGALLRSAVQRWEGGGSAFCAMENNGKQRRRRERINART
jgi:hypothetical protein